MTAARSSFSKASSSDVSVPTSVATARAPRIEIGLLTGGGDRPYAFGLAMALASKGVYLDFIGSDELDSSELRGAPTLNFLNLWGNRRPNSRLAEKISRVVKYYFRLVRYASVARPKVFHILWNNKFEIFDRTALMLYYKMLGKKLVLTAHNVNAGTRDSNDSHLNRLSLRLQYRLADHIFVHTERMKSELVTDFAVSDRAISVIPFGINNSVQDTDLTSRQAKERLGIESGEKTLLFFGNIASYKGLEYLIAAFEQIVTEGGNYRLIIAGAPKEHGDEAYVDRLQRALRLGVGRERTTLRLHFIPDDETELYFKAADVLVLPYTHIFQSGVLFLGYRFGLPVIAADVGSLREDIIEGKTGFLFKPKDRADLAKMIERYFASDLYENLSNRRQEIRDYAKERHSWDRIGETTRGVYAELLGD
jgi:D-inositol-3-phosphate glycosyltransferase